MAASTERAKGDDPISRQPIEPVAEKKDKEGFEGPWWCYPTLRYALLAGLLAVAGFVLAHQGLIAGKAEMAFYLFAIPLGGYHWTREGLERLFQQREIGIDILMLAATAGCGILGLWGEAAALVSLYGAAEGIEEYAHDRARSSIRGLLDLAPKEARLLREGGEVTVPAESLLPGDRFLIRQGEAVPTDGIIKSGASSLNESTVTGESAPVDKGPGTKVFAGTLNLQGALEVETTASFQDNTLSKIIHLVEEAQEQKGKAQQWIDRFGRRYTPAVLIASALFVAVPRLFGLPPAEWSYRAVVLLVAAAPCALVMSTPVAMAAGIGSAGKRGILIKGGVHLEHLGAIRTVAFDKTGTLTQGEPVVTDVLSLKISEKERRKFSAPGPTLTELLSLAAGLEHFSAHPLARAIVDHARSKGIAPVEVSLFDSLTGAGVKGVVEGVTWYVGNPDLFQRLGADLKQVEEPVRALQEQGKTVVLIGDAGEIRGLIALQDRLRPGVREVITDLHAAGIRVVMLTGDNIQTARSVAAALGIDDVRAELKPDEKVLAVKELEERDGAVLMVGDGVNDAPALAAATCGMAMGVAGSDAAIEAADVALMADDLGKVGQALRLGRKARKISIENITFSLLLLAALIPLGVSGYLSVAQTVLIHEVSELLAVVNGLRVARFS